MAYVQHMRSKSSCMHLCLKEERGVTERIHIYMEGRRGKRDVQKRRGEDIQEKNPKNPKPTD